MLRVTFGFDLYDQHFEEYNDEFNNYISEKVISLDIGWGMSTSFDASLLSDEEVDLENIETFICDFYKKQDIRLDDSDRSFEDVIVDKLETLFRELGIIHMERTSTELTSILSLGDTKAVQRIVLAHTLTA